MSRSRLTVGVTGGIGAGKSVVCRVLEILGAPVYDADSRARTLMEENDKLQTQIRSTFGANAYKGIELDREWLSKQVFGDADKLRILNNLVHPRVKQDFEHWAGSQDYQYVVKEAALLMETGSYKELDAVILVVAPEELRIERVLARDPHRSRSLVEEIINQQWKDEEKVTRADHVIQNDGKHIIIPEIIHLHGIFSGK